MVLWCDFFSGWISGMAGLVVGHPIDTIKVRQQITCTPVLHTIRYVHKQGGLLAFFRGMGAPLLTTGALNSVYFGFYGGSLDQIVKWNESHSHKSEVYGRKHEASMSVHFVAGCIGGFAQLSIGCPVDLVKVQLQSRLQKTLVKGPVDCVKQILRSNGIAGLYKGIIPQAWRDVPASGLYFVLYEFSKRQLSQNKPEVTKGVQFISGGIAGMLSWWSILPLDVIKSRVQGDCPQNPVYRGMVHCFKVILRTEGLRGLFQGFWPLSFRAFLVNGTTFLIYEYFFKHCVLINNTRTKCNTNLMHGQ